MPSGIALMKIFTEAQTNADFSGRQSLLCSRGPGGGAACAAIGGREVVPHAPVEPSQISRLAATFAGVGVHPTRGVGLPFIKMSTHYNPVV